jgi:anti-anti-sigma factor
MEEVMNNMSFSPLRIYASQISNTATIALSGHFTFSAHREFKATYDKLLGDSSVGNIVVNLADVDYLDSSALGMLLLLRDHVQETKKSLALSKPSTIAARTFEIAGFYTMFDILG